MRRLRRCFEVLREVFASNWQRMLCRVASPGIARIAECQLGPVVSAPNVWASLSKIVDDRLERFVGGQHFVPSGAFGVIFGDVAVDLFLAGHVCRAQEGVEGGLYGFGDGGIIPHAHIGFQLGDLVFGQ